MTILDVKSWGKRNVWRAPSGELAVRPGLRRLTVPTGTRRFVGGHSIQNPWTLEVWHYVADVDVDGRDLTVRIFDENFVEFQALATGVDVIPRGFSVIVVDQEVFVCSPDMPTLYGLVGSGLIIALKVASDNPNTTAINIPRGIGCSVANRAVIADGSTLYISDPTAITGGTIRTFVGQNANARPGVIFGVHEGAGGSLVCVTSAGTYTLDSAAFAVGVVGSNGTEWRLTNHHKAWSYDSSSAVKGRVYALTRRGFTLVDMESTDEALLDDAITPRLYGPRVSSPDWRTARLYASDDGPMVADGNLLCMSDLAEGLRSWWSCAVNATWKVRGTLRDIDGAMMILAEDGVYSVGGNVDGGQLLSTESATQARGVLFGEVKTNPAQNPTLRLVMWRAALGGVGNIAVAARGQQADSGIPDADTRSLIIGTSTWGAASTVFQPTPLARVDGGADFNFNSGDQSLELSADYPETRLGSTIDLTFSDSAAMRTQDRGAP